MLVEYALQNDVVHDCLEISSAGVDAHGHAVPLETAELGDKGREWLAVFVYVCLPVTLGQVQLRKDFPLHCPVYALLHERDGTGVVAKFFVDCSEV